jgi:hypothetical protein
MRWTVFLLAGFVALVAAPAAAQQGASGANVTVQLPNFSVFGVNTSVLVPDSGPSPLARERQAFYSRVMSRGLNPQRAFGVQRGAAMAAATAQVHDARRADEELLRAVRSRRTNWVRGSTPTALRSAEPAGGLSSLAEIERQADAQAAANNREAAELVNRARQAHKAGKHNVAGIYYDMAARKATGPLKADIDAKRRALARAPAAK